MGRLEDRVCIVTGAGAGIGRGIARRFAREGARIVVAEFDTESGERVAGEIEELGGQALFIETDIGEKAQVQAAVAATLDRFGQVDVVVNNAWSGSGLKRVEWMDDDTMRRAFEVGLMGAFWFMQECFGPMKARGYGRFVNFCSLNGVNAHMYTVNYNMTKEALRSLTRTAAREWAAHGITCNIVCPAAETEASSALRKVMPELFVKTDEVQPMGRMGDPEDDIAPVVLFLATEDSQYVTGNTLFVDGGSHINGTVWMPPMPEEAPQ